MRIYRTILACPYCKFIHFLLMLIFSLSFSSCYKMEVEDRTPDFPVKKCLEYDSKKTVDNICVALLPIQDEHEVDKYFGNSLYSASILPILVVAENANTVSSFLLPPDEAKIYLFKLDEVTKDYLAQTPSKITGTMNAKKGVYDYGEIKWKEGKSGRTAAGFITGLGMGITGIIVESLTVDPGEDIRTSAYSITKKSFRKETLSPRETESGFIFVKLPNETDKNHKLFVSIPVINMNSGQKINFDFIEDLNKRGD